MTAVLSCLDSLGKNAARWPSWIAGAPSLVAEALPGVAEPLAHWLRPGPAAAPEAVAAALARALLPPEASMAPPPWLREDQRLSFRRALAAIGRHKGALLADGVGTGKSFIALAVATALTPGDSVLVLAPAALLPQWRGVGKQIGIGLELHSHEQLSRGRLPTSSPEVVVIDESHRFRTPTTRRYETLAPWCVGRRGLLLSATPVVNRMEDLGHQLLLFVRNDALAWAGIAALTALDGPGSAGALAHLVITGEDRSAWLPDTVSRDLHPEEPPDSPLEALRSGISGLSLSRNPALASLLRGTLLVALASSPLAIAEALARYRSLLQHAKDAAAAGQSMSRAAIRRIVGMESEQLVLWPLLAEGLQPGDLALEDLEAANGLERAARAWCTAPDSKLEALRSVLLDDTPSMVFTQATATVAYLRRQLGHHVAWCTGRGSGLDTTRLEREAVLGWFRARREPHHGFLAPKLLLATDVAAEGLDLPLVRRVVHYDLPWTAVRLEQRTGRALRIGSRARSVEIIRILPPMALERDLRREAILERKSDLPERLGLGRAAEAPWRMRARIAALWDSIPPIEGVARVSGPTPGAVAGFRIELAGGGTHEVVLARGASGWCDDLKLMFGLLGCAQGIHAIRSPYPERLRSLLRGLAVQVRAALRLVQGARVLAASPTSRRVIRRLLSLAREATTRRDHARLELLERGLSVLRRGHTAGETRLVAGWHELLLPDLLANLERLPSVEARPEVTGVELIGILVVEGPCRSR